MLELIFVIVIIGIIGKFGLEFIAQAYNNFIFSSINNSLQSDSAMVVELISSRLQHRIRNSTITKKPNGVFNSIQTGGDSTYTILEWISSDIDGFRGNSLTTDPNNLANWSGVIDLDNSLAGINSLISPETNTTKINNLIDILSNGNSGIGDAALYFIGSNDSDVINGYGYSGTLTTQDFVIHPINAGVSTNSFISGNGDDFNGTDIYEYYKLAWTAYAVVYSADGNLTLHYDYQPWNGDTYLLKADGITPTKSSLIMQNVSTFRFIAINSLIKIQVCVKSNLFDKVNEIGKQDYSICKEKTIF